MLSASEVASIIQTGTGSPNGIHRYLDMAECPRKFNLKQQLKQAAASGGELYAYEEARDVGTLFHYMASCFHQGQPHNVPKPQDGGWPQDALAAIAEEALRLFADYSTRFKPDCWGKVVGAEVPLKGVIGGREITGQADLIVEVNEEQAASFFARTSFQLLPGTYVVDHKTAGQKDSNFNLKYSESLQCAVYMMLASQMGMQVQGMIINQIVRHKKLTDGSYCCTVVDPPPEWRVKSVENFLTYAEKQAATDSCSLGSCFNYNRACKFLTNGMCTRI